MDGAPIDGSAGRYQLLGEIARGGMGAVLKGRDPDLGRDLALKVLLDQHRDRADLVDRFVEEAQICGQLQHPGVVPVYELGTLADRRPFFAMKLVKGQTLAALLAGAIVARRRPAAVPVDLRGGLPDGGLCPRPGGDPSRPQAVERDGRRFGEVQVMDWGLAKVLPRDGQPAREPKAPPVNETVVATLRSKGDSDLSQAGSVLGTPAYMAPEQARGETEPSTAGPTSSRWARSSARSSPGRPAFGGDSAIEILRAAGRADTAAALDRLARCGADDELIALARDCLAAEAEGPAGRCGRGRRPARPATWPGVQERLRSRRAGPRRRGGPRRRKPRPRRPPSGGPRRLTARPGRDGLAGGRAGRRRLAVGRAGSAGPGPRGNGAGQRSRCRRRRGFAARRRVRRWATWPRGTPRRPPSRRRATCWSRASSRACGSRSRTWSPRSPPSEAGPRRRREAAERDRRLLDRLADIRSARADDRLGDDTDAAYREAFREAGIDPDVLTAEEAGRRIKARPPEIATALAMTLDDWAAVRRDLLKDAAGAGGWPRPPVGRPRPVAEPAPRRPGDRRSHRSPRPPDRPGRFASRTRR